VAPRLGPDAGRVIKRLLAEDSASIPGSPKRRDVKTLIP
jgi:hypothetical protein